MCSGRYTRRIFLDIQKKCNNNNNLNIIFKHFDFTFSLASDFAPVNLTFLAKSPTGCMIETVIALAQRGLLSWLRWAASTKAFGEINEIMRKCRKLWNIIGNDGDVSLLCIKSGLWISHMYTQWVHTTATLMSWINKAAGN